LPAAIEVDPIVKTKSLNKVVSFKDSVSVLPKQIKERSRHPKKNTKRITQILRLAIHYSQLECALILLTFSSKFCLRPY
jgi:hypothetical protein